MLKLISLQGFLNLSADAVRKIETGLKKAGLEQSGIGKYDDIDEFLDAIQIAVDEQHSIVVAAENEEYNIIKKQLMGKFGLDTVSSPDVAEAIAKSASELSGGKVPDMENHCIVPADAEIYLTEDGLYSGFCVEFSNGAKIMLVPLDITRLDVLLGYILEEVGVLPEAEENEAGEDEAAPEAEGDEETELTDAGMKVIFSDSGESKEEEPVSEEEEAPSDETEADEEVTEEQDEPEEEFDLSGFEDTLTVAGKAVYSLIQLDKTVAFVSGGELNDYINAMAKKVEGMSDAIILCDEEIENEEVFEPQVVLAKKTRLALKNNEVDFAVAVSPVLEEEKDEKKTYFSYIVIHDGSSARAKRVSTSSEDGIKTLIPHAFTVMFETINSKTEDMEIERRIEEDSADDEKKKKLMIIVGSAVLAMVAIISAVVMVWSYIGSSRPTTLPTENVNGTLNIDMNNTTSDTTTTTAPTISIPQITLNSQGPAGALTTDPSYNYPNEPTAGDITVQPTNPAVPSQKGVFTFTVYGYGHGVGLSQEGANYYAGIGWNYLEILAMYYYGTSLVMGDTYPETVNFGGTTYTMRDYLAITVESEMGAQYEKEALKAQAVAAYTFAKYSNFTLATTAHAFDKTPSKEVYEAVDAVIGQYITYNGQVCQTFYHAMSAGKTTSFANAFAGNQVPYLSGGRPSYGDCTLEKYKTTVTLTSDELAALVYSKTNMQLTGDPATWLTIESHDGCIDQNTGYVSYIKVGTQKFTGNKFRLEVLGGAIRSHCFTFTYTPTA
ncbi:MAG: hypothetical protein IKA56_04945 [Clostridia bacterium]|nr:hypothetical protein [Clostridia bacterium]